MDWAEFWSGATKFLEEASKFVAGIGVVVIGILQVWQRRTSNANKAVIVERLDKQDVALETFRVDAVEAATKAVEVKQAATEVKQAAAEVTQAAKEIVQAAPAASSADIRITKPL